MDDKENNEDLKTLIKVYIEGVSTVKLPKFVKAITR